MRREQRLHTGTCAERKDKYKRNREKITRKEKEKKEELEGAKAAWRHMCRQERQGQEKAREYKEREKEN